MLDQQDRLLNRQEVQAAHWEEQAAQREEQIRGLERQNMRLNELCDSYYKELRDYLTADIERKSGSIRDPVQVNHSELLASPSPIPSQESQLNEYGDVGARRAVARAVPLAVRAPWLCTSPALYN
jgi:hypothetical protein